MIVVSAGIIRRENRVLISQRKPGTHSALKWEFPGGKLERGETPRQALERELREELDVETRAGEIVDAIVRLDDGREILILFFFCELLRGEPRCVDCNALAWVEPSALCTYDLAPADAQIAAALTL